MSLRISHHWPVQGKISSLAFVIFNALLFGATAILDDPLPFLLILAATLFALAFLFSVKNFVECLLLLLFIFSIELVYDEIGLWALLSAFALVLVTAILRTLAEGTEEWRHSILTKEILMFIGVVFASLFWGSPFFTGYRLFGINLVLGFLIFYIAHFTISSFKSFHALTILLILILLINALYGIVFHLQFGYRALSFFLPTPTYSGHYFVQGFALAAGAFLSPPFRKLRPALAVVMVIMLMALFLTLTRGAWLAFVFLCALGLFFSNIPKRYMIYGGFGIVFILAAAVYLFSSNIFSAMLRERLFADVQNVNISVGSIAFRVLLWQSAWNLFLMHPLLGIGFDNFVKLNPQTPTFALIKGQGEINLYAHNIFLQVLAETGIVGFLILMLLIVAIYRHLNAMLGRVIGHRYRYLLLGYGAAISLWLFMGLTEAALYTPVTAIFFFFLLGVLSGFHKLLQREAGTLSA